MKFFYTVNKKSIKTISAKCLNKGDCYIRFDVPDGTEIEFDNNSLELAGRSGIYMSIAYGETQYIVNLITSELFTRGDLCDCSFVKIEVEPVGFRYTR